MECMLGCFLYVRREFNPLLQAHTSYQRNIS